MNSDSRQFIPARLALLNREDQGKKGRLRRLQIVKNICDAFRIAVDRAIKQIEKYDKPLAEHLKESIKQSNEVVYRPRCRSLGMFGLS